MLRWIRPPCDMESPTLPLRSVETLISRVLAERAQDLHVSYERLRGGLEAPQVQRVMARYRDEHGRPRTFTFVAKQLEGAAVREGLIYQNVIARSGLALAPRCLGLEHDGQDRAVLYLESVRRVKAWPWTEADMPPAVLHQLARFHATTSHLRADIPQWDYEAEIERSATATLEALERSRYNPALRPLRRYGMRATSSVVLALPRLRSELLRSTQFGSAPIHGDVHSGNALVRRRAGRNEPVLLDWGRARIGSPLEDVSSWLQSLSFWEQEAQRRRDTLLSGYLAAYGYERRLTTAVRAAYWVAAANNALAGALEYQLHMANTGATRFVRERAARAAYDWLRIIRRAYALACTR
jgi:hypothetical protein